MWLGFRSYEAGCNHRQQPTYNQTENENNRTIKYLGMPGCCFQANKFLITHAADSNKPTCLRCGWTQSLAGNLAMPLGVPH